MTTIEMTQTEMSVMHRIQQGLLAVTLFLLSFQPFLTMFSPVPELYDIVSPAFASIYLKLGDIGMVALLIVSIVIERRRFFQITSHMRRLVIPTGLLILLTLISALAARLPLLSLIAAVRLMAVLGLAVVVSRAPTRLVITPLILSILASAVLGAIQYALRRSVGLVTLGEAQITAQTFGVPVVVAEQTYYLRAIGFTVHPNILAPYLVTAITLLLGSALRRYPENAWQETLGVGLAAIGLALTYSRISWVSAAIIGLILIVGHGFQPSYRKRLPALINPLIVGLLVFAMFMATQSRQILSRFGFGDTISTSATDRALLMQVAFALFDENPVLGVGAHNFAVVASETFEITELYSHDFSWQPVHNFTALVTTELGIAGGITWVWLTITLWLAAWRTWRRQGLSSMALAWFAISVALTWNGLFDHFVWSLPEGMALMWVVWGSLAGALDRQTADDVPSEVPIRVKFPRLLTGSTLEWPAWLTISLAFVLSRLMIIVVILIAASLIPPSPEIQAAPTFPRNVVMDSLIRWNSGWYESVVSGGYFAEDGITNAGFFPVYPVLIWLISRVVGNVFAAGVLISNIAFAGALIGLYVLTRREFDDQAAGRAVFYMAAVPLSIFFSAMYAESLLLLFLIAAFYYAGQGRWVRAGIAGLLASATMPVGWLVLPVILLEARSQTARNWRVWVGAGLPVLGFAAYLVYIASTVGDVSTVFQGLLSARGQGWWAGDWIVVLAFLPVVIGVARYMRPAYAVFAAGVYLLALTGWSGASAGRTMLMLVPGFMLLGKWGERGWVERLILIGFLPLMALFTALFARWYWAG